MSLLDVEGLELGLRTPEGGTVPLVEDVSFSLEAGRMFALVGESGCGKSVTAAAIGGLLPGSIVQTGGRIRWGGGNAVRRGEGIAYVFQDPGECLDPVFTVGSQIAESLRMRGSRRERREEMERLLRRVGFAEPGRVLASYPHQLSGGQQQRAMLAMALAARPRLLVADEPTTALDVTVQAKILRLLAELQREAGLGVLLITHNLGVVAEVADEVAVMYAGRIVEAGPVRTVLRRPEHPYPAALLRALPRLDAVRGDELADIPGVVPPPGRRGPGCAFAPRCARAAAVCRECVPPWRTAADGRGVACHHAGGVES
jgi:oligopeptide/dipeptide ABC transporter ATP-binding protein